MGYQMPKHFAAASFEEAHAAGDACACPQHRSRGGYIRHGFAKGSAKEPYVIASRKLKDGRIQFTCGCPHWRYRCQSAGHLCKHQMAFLTGGITPKGKIDIKYTPSGEAFLGALKDAAVKEKVA